MDKPDRVLRRWYHAHELAEKAPGDSSPLAAERMQELYEAESDLMALRGDKVPAIVLLFQRARADRGCSHCWTDGAGAEHADCVFKISRWFAYRAAMAAYIQEMIRCASRTTLRHRLGRKDSPLVSREAHMSMADSLLSGIIRHAEWIRTQKWDLIIRLGWRHSKFHIALKDYRGPIEICPELLTAIRARNPKIIQEYDHIEILDYVRAESEKETYPG